MTTDNDLIVLLSGDGLATAPGDRDNWVERSGPGGRGGSLPPYIAKIAKALMRSGKSKSSAIAIAVSRTKKWAAGGDDVNPDTRAKAAKAVAAWEKMKAKSHVKLTNESGDTYIALSNVGEWSMRSVENAWHREQAALREAAYAEARERRAERYYDYDEPVPECDDMPWSYISEVWTSHIIVEFNYGSKQEPEYAKVPYKVKGREVEFGTPVLVESQWVVRDDDLTDNEKILLADFG